VPDVRRAEEQGLTGERLTTSGPILVVDDDEALRALLAATLASGGYCVLEAATGEEALQLARLEPPGLVALDVCLPGVSGYHVCHELRSVYGEGLPIIFISGVRTHLSTASPAPTSTARSRLPRTNYSSGSAA